MTNQNPCRIIKLNKDTGLLERPTLLLEDRSFNILGKISNYTNWQPTYNGNAFDEISFEVHKYVNNKKTQVWDLLEDLKIVEVKDYGRFEIRVSLSETDIAVKTITGTSLEVELDKVPLKAFYVNDDNSMDMIETDYNRDDYDKDGNYIPTTFCNTEDVKHSLLHRAIEKVPAWSLGYVTPYVTKGEDEIAEMSNKFQRTYTVDGTSIYGFLTGDVATETNVVFVFDTLGSTINDIEYPARSIHCFSLYDCKDEAGNVLVSSIGEDTTILVSKNKLANSISIESNADDLYNCFYVTGGDDDITASVAVINMTGSNYIYKFSDLQLRDMPDELKNKLLDYQQKMDDDKDVYYGENGIYPRLVKAQDDILYEKSLKMPNVDLKETSAGEQFLKIKSQFEDDNMAVGVYSKTTYSEQYYSGVTNNVVAMAEVMLDARYEVEAIKETAEYTFELDDDGKPFNCMWTGVLRFKRTTKETDVYPVETDPSKMDEFKISVAIAEDDKEAGLFPYTQQKAYKALQAAQMADINFNLDDMTDEEIKDYYKKYAYNRLEGFASGYESCLSVLMGLQKEDSLGLYDVYNHRYQIVKQIMESMYNDDETGTINILEKELKSIQDEQIKFQNEHNLRNFLGDNLYKLFATYQRVSDYNNTNYISDNLSDNDILKKAKELVESAEKELEKACTLQRTVSTDLNNLLLLPEFQPLYEKFALFNYIRIKTEDEVLKMRLLSISYSEDSSTSLSVTFSEKIESVGTVTDDVVNDVASILAQASSIASSYSSTMKQAEKGNDAKEVIEDMYSRGLNATNMTIKNSDNNEVLITRSGILCRRMDDNGIYGLKQMRITSNMIALSDDAFDSVKTAIGEIEVENPISGEVTTMYGVNAEVLIGKLILGEKAIIGNDSGNVQIDGNGINVTGGSIRISDDEYGSVIIDPKQTVKDGYIFAVTNNDDEVVVGVNIDGDAEFSGTVYASGGIISGNMSVTGSFTGGTVNGAFINGGHLNIGNNNFIVDTNGNLTTKGIMSLGNGNLTYSSSNGLSINGSLKSSSSDNSFVSIKNGKMSVGIENSEYGRVDYGLFDKLKGIGLINRVSTGGYVALGHTEGNTSIIDYYIDSSNFNKICHYFNSSVYFNGSIYPGNNGFFISGFKNNGKSSGLYTNGEFSIGSKLLVGNIDYGALLNVSGKGYIDGSLELSNSLILPNNTYIRTNPAASDSSVPLIGWSKSDNIWIGTFNSTNRADKIILSADNIYHKSSSGTPIHSDLRLKKNFSEINNYKEFIMNLKPYSYKYIDGTSNRTHMGFIAQDVEENLLNTVGDMGLFVKYNLEDEEIDLNNQNTYICGLRYDEFIAPIVQVIQDQDKEIEKIKSELSELKQLLLK